MPESRLRSQWVISLVIFAAIVLALIIAAVIADPFTANIT
jgi:hypothetical protein